MPYHQPKKLGLDVFLARTKQKQEALNAMKGPKYVYFVEVFGHFINRSKSEYRKDVINIKMIKRLWRG